MIKIIMSFCLIFSSVLSYTFENPKGFITLHECASNGNLVKFVLDNQFVLTLQNAIVVDEGAIVTSDGKILTDTETYKRDQQKILQNRRDLINEDPIFFDGSLAVISSPGQQCYYHWILQVLPRLKILKEANVEYDKIYIYPYNYKYQWQKETLAAVMNHLDIPQDKILLIPNNKENIVVHAKKLIVPSVAWKAYADFSSLIKSWYKKFFNDVFLKNNEIKTSTKIFISRSKASYRRISNEKLLLNFLISKGFVSVSLEELSIFEQAKLFNNAEIIIGPHGAGWTNLIFCKPNTKIIEIDHGINSNEQRSGYKKMTELLECKYHPFYVDLLEPTDSPENILEPINQDMIVDVKAFECFYNKLNFY